MLLLAAPNMLLDGGYEIIQEVYIPNITVRRIQICNYLQQNHGSDTARLHITYPLIIYLVTLVFLKKKNKKTKSRKLNYDLSFPASSYSASRARVWALFVSHLSLARSHTHHSISLRACPDSFNAWDVTCSSIIRARKKMPTDNIISLCVYYFFVHLNAARVNYNYYAAAAAATAAQLASLPLTRGGIKLSLYHYCINIFSGS